MVKETEDEQNRMSNMRNLLPKNYKKQKHMFDDYYNINEILSKKNNWECKD